MPPDSTLLYANTNPSRHSFFGRIFQHHQQVHSTMPLAHDLVRQAETPAASAGALIVAEEQTLGRGRLDRRWDAPPGRALLSSFVVADPVLPAQPAQLPMIAGLAVLLALRQTVPILARQIWLKWPNDLIVVGDGAIAKLAGILIESAYGPQGMDYAVLGIGINVNQRAADLPAPRPGGIRPVSLYALLHRETNRADLLLALCQTLDRLLVKPSRPTPEALHQQWQANLMGLNRPVTVVNHDTRLSGHVVGTTLEGSLILTDSGNKRYVVEAGDAEFLWQRPE